MNLVLDLNNFDTPEAEGSRYVLTSPRSLEACARMKVRPVQLLPKPIEDFVEENPGKPLPLLQVFHDNHELKRVELLQKCREMRQTIIMEDKVNETQKNGGIPNGKNGIIPEKSKSSPRQSQTSKKKDVEVPKLVKSLGERSTQDENNNSTNGVVSPGSDASGKKVMKPLITPRKFGQPLTPGKASFTESRSRPLSNSTDEDGPYMMSTPVIAKRPTPAMRRSLDQRGRMPPSGDSTPRSRALTDRSVHDRKRSRSLDAWKRKMTSSSCDIELASSLKFAGSNFMSGQSTPRQQKDQKMVDIMKEKRKQRHMDAARAIEIQKEWEEERRKEERRKLEESLAKEKSLRLSHLEWEKKLKETEDRRVREQKRNEIAKLTTIEEAQKQLEKKKREQALLQRSLIEERKRAEALKKRQQEVAKESVDKERQAFLDATERELEIKMEKAQKVKLEKEMKQLDKLKYLNKSQREKFLQLEKELKKRTIDESERKRTQIDEKMEKADILRMRKIAERDHVLQLQAKEEDLKIQKTKEKQEELIKKNDEHLQSIAERKKEVLKKANETQTQTIQTKARRAHELRESCHDEQKRRMKEIEKEDQKHLAETKEQLDIKDFRAKTHQQLKEAAIQLSRANARATEAARLEVKQKDDTFLEASKHAKLITSIGRGPRTGLVNASSVKLG